MVSDRLSGEADDRFVRACLDATRGNPFLVGELLSEAAARGIAPISAEAGEIATIVPRGVSNSVLLRLGRLGPHAGALARALSILGDGGQIGDAARLSGLSGPNVEAGMAGLIAAAIVEPGGTVRFTHPILRSAIYGDLSPAERERLHQAAAGILREREAPGGPGRGAPDAH
jgi:hypothetical protein